MFRIDGIFYRTGLGLYNFMYLNILFIISCIPIITIYPAISALFGVVRKWKKNEDDRGVFTLYKDMFIENWKQGYLTGILFTLIGCFIAFDFLFISQMTSPYKVIIVSALIFFSFLTMISFISIYPVMIHINTSFKQLCISSIKVGVYKIHLSIFCLILLSAWSVLSLRFTFLLLFFFFSVSAYLIYWIADIKFKKLLPQEEEPNTIAHEKEVPNLT